MFFKHFPIILLTKRDGVTHKLECSEEEVLIAFVYSNYADYLRINVVLIFRQFTDLSQEKNIYSGGVNKCSTMT